MQLPYENVWINVIIFLAVIAFAIVTYCKRLYTFWERNGVPYLPSTVPFGNVLEIFTRNQSYGEVMAYRYKIAKSKKYKHLGLFGFTKPEYMPIDLELLKDILIKDFNYFCDRGFYSNEEIDVLSGNLFSLGGNKWRKMRTKLSPTFTSGKIKTMFNIVLECSRQLKHAVDIQCEKGPMDVKDFLSRFGTDVIGSCAFGLNCNSFVNAENEFCVYSQKLFNPTIFESFKGMMSMYFPVIIESFKAKIFSVEMSDFYIKTFREVVEYRKKNNVVRNDFLQILIALMEDESSISMEEATAQAFVFFLAGFETSSTVLTFCLLELVLNEEVQDKLRKEINDNMKKHNNIMTYDSIKELVYMRQVLDEVMRKYPPVATLNRQCVMDYKISNTDLVLKKGTNVIISVLGIQNDPEYFPEPEKFDPERFSPTNKENLSQFCYMPFGEGPRVCIGLRFGVLQMKIALSMLLNNYRFTLNEKTVLPVKMNPRSFILSPMGSILLNVEKI
ncbi:hypothetical protein FQR65_LT00126 [Abscondita terminalis]|nr:hypothetical protein FQR65_LT00126 [Abscondita terminalis]